MKDNKYYENIEKNIDYGALVKNIAGEKLTQEEKEMCEKAKELGDAAREARALK